MSDNNMPEFSKMATAAITLHELFESLIEAGFNDEQAIRLTVAYVQASVASQG